MDCVDCAAPRRRARWPTRADRTECDVKFRVERDALADAVTWAARSLASRPTLPGARRAAAAGRAASSCRCPASTSRPRPRSTSRSAPAPTARRWSPGGCWPTSPARCRRTRSTSPSTGSRLTIACGSARFTLPTMPVDDYPTLPSMPTTAGTVDGAEFAAAVAQVAVAAGRDDTLPMLTGVRLEIDGDKLTLAATDRYRLAVRELGWNPGDPTAADVAGAGAGPHAGRRRQEPGPQRGADDRAVRCRRPTAPASGIIGFSGTDERPRQPGHHPPARRDLPALPLAAAQRVGLERRDPGRPRWSRRSSASPWSPTATRPVRLEFADGAVALTAGGDDEGRAEEQLEVAYEGEPITTAFNPQFLLDGLGALATGTARMLFTSSTKPVVLRPEASRRRRVHVPDHAGAAAGLSTAVVCTSGTCPSPTSAAGPAPTSPSSPAPSVLVGANGQGKTNLVEALGYLATLGSHRVATDAPLIRAGAERAVVRAAVVADDREHARRGRDRGRPGQPGAAQRHPGAPPARHPRRAARRAVRARGPRRSCGATRASAAASSTSWSSPARPRHGRRARATTSGCSSSGPRC